MFSLPALWVYTAVGIVLMIPIFNLNLEAVSQLVTVAVSGGGALLAILGLDAWKRQLHGNKDHEIAWKYLEAVFKVRNAINKVVRNPGIFPGETKKAAEELYGKENVDYEMGKNSRAGDVAVYQIRWNELTKARRELDDVIVQAEIWWGESVVGLEKELNASIGELFVNLKIYLDTERQDSGMKWNHETMYYLEGHTSEFDEKLNKAIRKMEVFARPYLRGSDGAQKGEW